MIQQTLTHASFYKSLIPDSNFPEEPVFQKNPYGGMAGIVDGFVLSRGFRGFSQEFQGFDSWSGVNGHFLATPVDVQPLLRCWLSCSNNY
jgi:hypothetical protein